jgi:hypothetical protein
LKKLVDGIEVGGDEFGEPGLGERGLEGLVFVHQRDVDGIDDGAS